MIGPASLEDVASISLLLESCQACWSEEDLRVSPIPDNRACCQPDIQSNVLRTQLAAAGSGQQ